MNVVKVGAMQRQLYAGLINVHISESDSSESDFIQKQLKKNIFIADRVQHGLLRLFFRCLIYSLIYSILAEKSA